MASPPNPTSSTAPSTMRAWTHTSTGPPRKVLKLTTDFPVPKITNPTDVLVKVAYTALNPGGSLMTELIPMIFRTKPSIPELDFSGTVVQLGSDISDTRNLKSGDAVFGSISLGQLVRFGQGTLAEFVVVPAENVCLVPEGMKMEEAAGLGVAGCTALALVDAAKLKGGEKALIYGASGGCGSLVVQLVKEAVGTGGKVVAVCSRRNFEMVRGLGADEVIDYQEHDPVHTHLTKEFAAEPFDVIIDCFGSQALFQNCAKFLKPGKTFVSIGLSPAHTYWGMLCVLAQTMSNFLWPAWLGGVNRPYSSVLGIVALKELNRLMNLIQEGKLRVPIDSSWDMEDALKAADVILSKRARGKVVVKIQDI